MSVHAKYFDIEENPNGSLCSISVRNDETFNFAYDVVDEIAQKDPDKLCMLWVDCERNEERFSFEQMREKSVRAANYFKNLGIGKGDRVMLIMKRHYQFWFAILALHRLGAVAIPATHQLRHEDLLYRFVKGDIKAVVCTDKEPTCKQADRAVREMKEEHGREIIRIMTGEALPGWHSFDRDIEECPDQMERVDAGGTDPMLMFFTSGTTGYPKIVTHDFRYPLRHYVTARYWLLVSEIESSLKTSNFNHWFSSNRKINGNFIVFFFKFINAFVILCPASLTSLQNESASELELCRVQQQAFPQERCFVRCLSG